MEVTEMEKYYYRERTNIDHQPIMENGLKASSI